MHGRIVSVSRRQIRGRRPAPSQRHYDLLFVEWSEPDDGAWEDPSEPESRSWGLPGEPEYPLAPVPAHERRWRHPSELGQAAWVQSERPVGLGRGLMITTGAIGCILGLAVVWLMVPGPANSPAAAPTVTRSDLALPTTASFGFAATTEPDTIAPGTVAETTIGVPRTTAAAITTLQAPITSVTASPATATPSSLVMVLPAEDLPTNTVWLTSDAEGTESAVAVLVGDSPFAITTATAVGSEETVMVTLESGSTAELAVVSTDETFAYIEPDESLRTFGFAAAAPAVQGDDLTVLDDEQFVFTFGDDTLDRLDPAAIAEGTPVVNEQGALVGLCTRASGRVDLVPIVDALGHTPAGDTSTGPRPLPQEDPPGTQSTVTTSPSAGTNTGATNTGATALPASTASPVPTTTTTSTTVPTSTTSTVVTTTTTVTVTKRSPWIGIRLGGNGARTELTVTTVTPGSPAASAGIAVGEEIASIDGGNVTSVEQVAATIASRAPGDTIVITTVTVASDGTRTRRDVSVVLGENSL
jgi:hypothetical protein